MIFNQLKTVALLGILTGLMLFIGGLFGRGSLIVAFVLVLLMNFFAYFFSDKFVLFMYRAKEVKSGYLFDLVKEVKDLADVPMPKVYTIPSSNLNAFATGRSPKNAAVACTEGIVDALSKEELKGVIAHEMAHIKNRDILIATIAATIAGIISFLAMMARYGAIFGGLGRDREDGGNVIELLVLSILAPIIAMIIQLAISRSREYMADNKGAMFIRNPNALADALEKLERHNKMDPLRFGSPTSASLFIVNPFNAKGVINLFSTHPDVSSRVKRLRNLQI